VFEASFTRILTKGIGTCFERPFFVFLPVAADYDGDGKADIGIFRPNAVGGAQWWVRRSSNASVFALQFGTSTDKTVQGDYTGDGEADSRSGGLQQAVGLS